MKHSILNLSEGQLRIAEAAGLMHDLGRFKQYRRYRTFNDRRSVNHASLGVRIMRRNHILQDLDGQALKAAVDTVQAVILSMRIYFHAVRVDERDT